MFKDNKYKRWYDTIIHRALSRDHTALDRVEWHHAIPKSLGGGKKDKAALTPREHFVCHMLLVRMLDSKEKRKMSWAVHRMLFSENPVQQRYRPGSHTYAHFREQFYSETRGKPRVITDAHRANIAIANRKHKKDKPLSIEHREALVAARKWANVSDERRAEISAAQSAMMKARWAARRALKA